MRATTILRFATPVASPKSTTINSSTPNLAARPSRSRPALSLEHFLLRSRVLGLYRTIARAVYQIPDKDARRGSLDHAKGEFARNKHVTDTAKIRYLVSTGKAEWDGMRRYIEELAIRGR